MSHGPSDSLVRADLSRRLTRRERRASGRGSATEARPEVDRTLEVGWNLLSDFHRQGYATEIGREGLRFAQMQLSAKRSRSSPSPSVTTPDRAELPSASGWTMSERSLRVGWSKARPTKR